jgi:hypothetical protein
MSFTRHIVELLACHVPPQVSPGHGASEFGFAAIVPVGTLNRSKELIIFTELKQAAARPDRSKFLDVVRIIFHLEEDSGSEVSLAIN